MDKARFTLSFRLKTILGVALIEAVLLTVLVVSGVHFMSSTAETQFEQRTRATVKAFSVVAKDALIASDLAALNALVREMLTYPGVSFARVRGEQGDVLAQAGDSRHLLSPGSDSASLADSVDGVYRTGVDIRVGTQHFGRVELGVSAGEVQTLQTTARRYGAGLALLEMVLVALFSWALGSYLTRQLDRLAQASRRIADGDLGYQMPVQGQDELARTALAFNRMSLRLSESYANVQRSEHGLRQVLENILDGIFTLDRNLRVLSASPAAERILQRGADALAGRSLAACFTPVAWARLCETLAIDDGAQLGEPMVLDGLLPGGRRVPLEVRMARIAGHDAAAILVIVRDVSERLAAEKALRLRSHIIDAIGVGVVIADARLPDQPIVYANLAFERITGWRFADAVGRNCRFLQGPDTDAHEVARLRHAIAEGRDVEVLLLNVTRDGRPFWNELRVMPIRDPDGTLTHFVALQNDVTARIRGQQEIARREEHLRRVVNATHDGIIVIDEHGTIESFNAGAERLFGHAAAEVIGQDVAIVVPAPHKARHAEYMQRYATTGETRILGQEREFEATRKDGASVWIALRVGLLEEGPGPHRRFIGVIHDITERKRAEIELRHAKEAAEDAASAKSEFLANMSHEIRTPMHGVLGAIEMLQDTPLTGQQERYLDTARTSASILLGVIDEILDFSRLEAGKLRIESIDFDLRRTVEDVTAMLAQRAHAKKLELACFIAPEVPETVRGDPIRLRQVLVNLIGNAIKFTERGEVVVSVGLVASNGSGNGSERRLRFEVRDTGIGIPQDKQAALFQPFTQADSSTSRRFGGSGLGLSIAKRLVELMQGTIGLHSETGQGSRFWFQLPAAVVGPLPRERRVREFPGTRVLVVDDNATNRIILHRYLTAWNSQSGSAASGDEALAKLQDAAASGRPYEVALLDLNMPGMDGYTLVRRIQADPALAAMPLIMLSSSNQDPAQMAGLRVDVWLDKPVRQSDLHDAISTVLQHRPALTAAPPAGRAPAPRALQFSGERVLLVEDNPITRDVGAQMLRRRGLTVLLAEDGLKALLAVQGAAVPPDLVLMDVQMPGMDGYTATREIRAWELASGRPRLPIVALTAHALPGDRDKCLAAGMDDYVVKPYSAEAIGTVIARWLMPPGHEAVPEPAPTAAPTPAAADPTACIDMDRFEQVRAVMGDAIGDLLDKVHETLQAEIAGIRDATVRGDATALRELVHRLKNTAGDIGAMLLHERAAQTERQITRENTTMPDITPLDTASRDALAAVERLRQRMPA